MLSIGKFIKASRFTPSRIAPVMKSLPSALDNICYETNQIALHRNASGMKFLMVLRFVLPNTRLSWNGTWIITYDRSNRAPQPTKFVANLAVNKSNPNLIANQVNYHYHIKVHCYEIKFYSKISFVKYF